MIVSYRRVSSDRQDIGLDAQQAAIDAYLDGHPEIATPRIDFAEKQSAKNMRRPILAKAIDLVEHEHGTLIVAKLDRLSRSVADFATLIDRANKYGWTIIVCDLNIDMTTPSGRLIANIMASLAEWERHMIGQRTKEALAEKRKQGIRPGKPVSEQLALRIRNWRDTGMSLSEIADHLEYNNIQTPNGKTKWARSTVFDILTKRRAV